MLTKSNKNGSKVSISLVITCDLVQFISSYAIIQSVCKGHAILDAGSCVAGTDQRGLPRPVDLATSGLYPNADNGCDIGAVEAQGETPTAVILQSISANSSTAILPILIAALLLALMGGAARQRWHLSLPARDLRTVSRRSADCLSVYLAVSD